MGRSLAFALLAVVVAATACAFDDEPHHAPAPAADARPAEDVPIPPSVPDASSPPADDEPTDPLVECAPPSCPAIAGLSCHCIEHDGGMRTFQLYAPASAGDDDMPLVFAHHGWTMSGDIMRQLTDFTALADAEGFAVIFPDGASSTWDTGGATCGAGATIDGTTDDIGFVEQMIELADQRVGIDRARVFTTGFSMGGYFTNNIGCQRPDLVRAIAPHSGGGPPPSCAGPVPVLILHGTADALIAPACGTEARDAWLAHNGCDATFVETAVAGGTCQVHDCPAGAQVTLCTFDGMSHGWAGHVYSIYGGGASYADATKLVWDFFAAQ